MDLGPLGQPVAGRALELFAGRDAVVQSVFCLVHLGQDFVFGLCHSLSLVGVDVAEHASILSRVLVGEYSLLYFDSDGEEFYGHAAFVHEPIGLGRRGWLVGERADSGPGSRRFAEASDLVARHIPPVAGYSSPTYGKAPTELPSDDGLCT